MRRFVTIGALALLALPLAAARADIEPVTRWNDPTRVTLNVEFPGDGYHASWDLYRCACGDLLVHSELDAPDETERGETLLVGGRAVLYRGFAGREAEYGASLDAPALMMQLAAQLLERLEPAGPARITEKTELAVTEETQHIDLDTGTASGAFQAPWTVTGMIAPDGPDARRFDLRLEFSVRTGDGVQQAAMRLTGRADYARTAFPVAGDEPLERWTLTWRESTDPARPRAADAATLDDLRALLNEE
jgi:hypothetical protein